MRRRCSVQLETKEAGGTLLKTDETDFKTVRRSNMVAPRRTLQSPPLSKLRYTHIERAVTPVTKLKAE